jgi:hypothetical protein
MSLTTRFQQASESYTIKVNSLAKNQPYSITLARCCDTPHGLSVLLTIWESKNSLKKVFLPWRYSEIIMDKDLTNINSGSKKFGLFYMGMFPHTKDLLLAITEEI